ncbi:MAG: hypothetical protein Ta2D_10720 [Rickettsiales bacterium]|nr:MAG: hypothetical protein Ta2D_10720 [Rickettsiales bacterium]
MKKIFILFFAFTQLLFAAGTSLVVDAEIEDFLKDITKPILKSANIDFESVNFYIVDDNSINAFVSGGQNIFVNTGTLTAFNTPDALLGILAHEIGHIAGGHIANFGNSIKKAQGISIGGILLGVGALIAGAPDVAQFLLLGGVGAAQQQILHYSRTQEETADSLGTQYLQANGMSAQALLISMNTFYKQELDLPNNTEYFITHPLSRNRKERLEQKIKAEKGVSDAPFNDKYQRRFDFIKAKILGYKMKDLSGLKGDYLIYAKAISNNSLDNANYLSKKEPKNPYFYELKADILLKKRQPKEALENYFIVDNLLKSNVLIKKTIAFIVAKYEQKEYYKKAISLLKYVELVDSKDYSILKLLAELYYLDGDKGKSTEYFNEYNTTKKEMEERR